MAVVVHKSFKLYSCGDGEGCEEQVRDHFVANEKVTKIHAENDGRIERIYNNGSYPKKKWRPPREWWMNHILPEHDEELPNVVLFDDHFNLDKVWRSKYARKWEAAMQEEFNLLMAGGMWKLTKLPKVSKDVRCE